LRLRCPLMNGTVTDGTWLMHSVADDLEVRYRTGPSAVVALVIGCGDHGSDVSRNVAASGVRPRRLRIPSREGVSCSARRDACRAHDVAFYDTGEQLNGRRGRGLTVRVDILNQMIESVALCILAPCPLCHSTSTSIPTALHGEIDGKTMRFADGVHTTQLPHLSRTQGLPRWPL